MKITKKPYSKRSDHKKLEDNWRKTLGLFKRGEHSMAILRAGTCAEIAANIVVRSELIQKRSLEPRFVDSLLRWANGLQGKFSRIILPIVEGTPQHAILKRHHKEIGVLNEARNEIAHGGRFASETEALKLLRIAQLVCDGITSQYPPTLRLKKI